MRFVSIRVFLYLVGKWRKFICIVNHDPNMQGYSMQIRWHEHGSVDNMIASKVDAGAYVIILPKDTLKGPYFYYFETECFLNLFYYLIIQKLYTISAFLKISVALMYVFYFEF